MTLPPPILTPEERAKYRRCGACEWDVAAQGHHPDCPKVQTRDGR